jgi:hypothetical protein
MYAAPPLFDFSEKLGAEEKEIIEAALRETKGRVFGPSGAAAKLGMPGTTLDSKIKSLKISKNRFKTAIAVTNPKNTKEITSFRNLTNFRNSDI